MEVGIHVGGRAADDVLYHLYLIQAAEGGLEDVAHDRVITHDAVAEELRRKWQAGRAK